MLRAILATLCAAFLLIAHGVAHAGAISVSPVMLEMSTKRPTRTLEISNPSDQPVHVQLRVFAWSGGGVDEQYAPTQDIGFSPPMFELAPGQRQVVRLAARITPDRETAYRLFVDQLEAQRPEGGLSMPVRMALPLFLSPDQGLKAQVDWRFERDDQGPLLVARNRGARRLRLTDLELEKPGGAETVARGLAGYVLAGQERAWRVKPPSAAGPVAVRAMSDQGPLRAEIARD